MQAAAAEVLQGHRLSCLEATRSKLATCTRDSSASIAEVTREIDDTAALLAGLNSDILIIHRKARWDAEVLSQCSCSTCNTDIARSQLMGPAGRYGQNLLNSHPQQSPQLAADALAAAPGAIESWHTSILMRSCCNPATKYTSKLVQCWQCIVRMQDPVVR